VDVVQRTKFNVIIIKAEQSLVELIQRRLTGIRVICSLLPTA